MILVGFIDFDCYTDF